MEINEIDGISYYFAIVTTKSGTNWPIIRVQEYGPIQLVEALGTTELIESKNVKKFIENLDEKIMNNEGNSKFWLYHNDLDVEILGQNVKINLDSAELIQCTISLNGLQKILSQWYNFLLAYENGEIPGIKKNFTWKR